jgi:hypothetical protein
MLLSLGAIGLAALGGCGGDDDGGVDIDVQVEVSPETATVGTGQSIAITAVVVEGDSEDVEWYVDDVLGGNATVGTVTQTNPTTYTAPAALPDPVTVVVKAVSTDDDSKFDTCTITLTQNVVVSVTPTSGTVGTSSPFQITANVAGGTTNQVQWYVDDILGGNTTVGTVTQTNPTTYTAPAVLPDPVTVVVKAVSTEDPTKFETCTVTLTQGIVVNVTPDSDTLNTYSTREITASVAGGITNEIEWYVDDVLGGNTTVGTVTQANPTTYTAPAALPDPVTVVVKAVSTEDGTKFDTCTITLTQEIVVNVTPASGTIGASSTFQITAAVSGGATNDVEWYVNDIKNGNVLVGVVSQANPTTYTAPSSVPSPATVVVKAISTEDASRYDSCLVTVTEPPDISVDVSPEREEVEVSESVAITATVTGGTTGDVLWYVDGIAGGNSTVGTVTQTNPATYTAPDEIPSPDSVRVVAVSEEDVSESDTCVVKIIMTTIYVDATTGNDDTGTGSAAQPLKTITRGLEVADPGETIRVAPGIYDATLGEEFPITVALGKKIVGENWETCIIRGYSETTGYSPCVQFTQTNSTLRKFTIEEGPIIDDGWRIPIFVGNIAYDALIDSIRCMERAQESIVRVESANNTIIQNCVFDVRAISEVNRGTNRCIVLHQNDQGTILRNCEIKGFHNAGAGKGIYMTGVTDVLIEGCAIEDNGWGIYLCCDNSEEHNPVPDLGGGARGSAGGNTIRNNDTCGIESNSTADVYARFNTWTNDPPVEGVDYCIQEAGDIIVE